MSNEKALLRKIVDLKKDNKQLHIDMFHLLKRYRGSEDLRYKCLERKDKLESENVALESINRILSFKLDASVAKIKDLSYQRLKRLRENMKAQKSPG